MKKRIKNLRFHVEAGDYFGTLATILDLLRQGIVKEKDKERVLSDLTADLMYLQHNFTIVEGKNEK